MENELESAARRFLDGEEGRRISNKKDDIQRIASSKDGETVKNMLEKSGFEDAFRRGDTKALRDAVAGVINTDSGARLVASLKEMMKK